MVSTTLAHRYPNFDFLGEETAGTTPLSDNPTFILDPIDGTNNFVHRHPYVAISLGFAISRNPVIGVVYNPFTQQLYTAIKSRGAYLTQNGKTNKLPLAKPVQRLNDLSSCLCAVEWGSDRSGQNMACKLGTFANLTKPTDQGGAMVHGLRSLGSAALNLCNVAAGSIDVYWEGGCYAWDVCAGWCILAETGGVVVDANPGGWECRLDGRRYFAIRGDAETEEADLDGDGKGKSGMKFTAGQKRIIEGFWKCVAEGGFDYVAP
jgi:myo-inositol-1(or 4)-monophosphatase